MISHDKLEIHTPASPAFSTRYTLPFSVDFQPSDSNPLAHSSENIGGYTLSFPFRNSSPTHPPCRINMECGVSTPLSQPQPNHPRDPPQQPTTPPPSQHLAPIHKQAQFGVRRSGAALTDSAKHPQTNARTIPPHPQLARFSQQRKRSANSLPIHNLARS
jgi:hypothetical protein